MAAIRIYTTPYCPYCMRAKALLKAKGAAFDEIDVSQSQTLRAEMIERAGGKYTVPQIFIGERYIGGSDDLRVLDAKGELERLLET